MACKNQLDDEFFGDLHDHDASSTTVTTGNSIVDLETAEAAAVERHFHTLGFHEAYESAKDALLQEGFEDGYQQNFEAAERIGRLLGEHMARTRLIPTTQATSSEDDRPKVALIIRTALLESNVSLNNLEEQVKECIKEYTA